MAHVPICTLPLDARIPPRIDDENSGRLRQVQRHAAGLERNEEDLDVGVVHEIFDRLLALRGRHAAVQHDGVEAGPTEAPLDELQHGRELREDNRLVRSLLAAELPEIVDQHFDLGRRGPVFHLDPVNDGILLYVLFVLLDIRLIKVDGERDVAARTVWLTVSGVAERPDVVFGAFAAEFVVATRADRLFGGFVADAANQHVLAAFGVFLEYQVRVVGDLAHLHDKTEDVGVVVQHHAAADVRVELPMSVRHDAG